MILHISHDPCLWFAIVVIISATHQKISQIVRQISTTQCCATLHLIVHIALIASQPYSNLPLNSVHTMHSFDLFSSVFDSA